MLSCVLGRLTLTDHAALEFFIGFALQTFKVFGDAFLEALQDDHPLLLRAQILAVFSTDLLITIGVKLVQLTYRLG